MDPADPYSRPFAAGAALKSASINQTQFLNKRVLLTGELPILQSANGQECLLDSLLLLFRICPSVTIAIPPGLAALSERCQQISDTLTFNRPVQFCSEPNLADYDSILSVGTRARPDLPWTVINSNGWLVRVSSGVTSLPNDTSIANPIAALAAASLGVADVFKRLIHLREDRARYFDGLNFSLLTYACGDREAGPPLPNLVVSAVVVGAGAIGNGVLHLFSRLTGSGDVWIVDSQKFGPENLGTCLRIGPQDVGEQKAAWGKSLLGEQYHVRAICSDLKEVAREIASLQPFPRIFVGCVDNIEARHELQRFWPDVIVDGAIGADFACQVSHHLWGADVACLQCLFRIPIEGSAESIASEATGLERHRILDQQSIVTASDVTAAPSEKKAFLESRIGRKVCSVIAEGMAQRLSMVQQSPSFAPSVPFVACLSASMVMAEVVKFAAGWTSPLAPRFQLDTLRGPAFGMLVPQLPRADCICHTRAGNIDKVRRSRGSAI